MSDSLHIADFLIPLNKPLLSDDRGYKEGQVGFAIEAYEDEMPDLEQANIVFIGCGEQRGAGIKAGSDAADEIRKEFYDLYYWHQDIRLADLGNIKLGKELNDTYADLKISKKEMLLRSVAWQQAVKAGFSLTEKEMQNLVSDLFVCNQPNITPSGKPTYMEFKKDQLDKIFGR
jgi:hypothetical protein